MPHVFVARPIETHDQINCRLGSTTVADDPSQRGPQDRTRINVNQEHELRYWARHFGVTAEQLKDAVKQVGDHTEKVEKFLWGK